MDGEISIRISFKLPNKNIFFSFIQYPRNLNSDSIQEVKSAYLETAGREYNIIAVDWEESASDMFYFNAAYATKIVGKYVGHVINHMSAKHDVNLKDVHIIAHSLGAHV